MAAARRLGWQWLVFAAVVGETLLQLVWLPYTYYGGPGVLGSRYYMNIYGLQLFLLPALSSVGVALVPWVVGGLFTAKITLNPFYSSFHPHEHAKAGPLRWLPIELTLVNDLPINVRVGPRAAALRPGPAIPDLLPRRQRVSARRRVVLDSWPLPRRPAVQDAGARAAS